MVHVLVQPSWFFGMDVLFEFSFAIITLVLSLFSFKIYKLSNQNSSRLFGQAFLFFSISYFLQSLLNLIIVSELIDDICTIVKVQNIATLTLIGTYIHVIFFITGLVVLTYMTWRIENEKAFLTLLVIALSSLVLSVNQIYWFYALSSIFLFFISLHYYSNYSKTPRIRTLLVFLAFIFLFIGHIHFIFATDYGLFYTLGHFLELGAYVLILINLLLILKK